MNFVRKNQVLALLLLLLPVHALGSKKQNRVGRQGEKLTPVFTKDSKAEPGILIAKPGPDVKPNVTGRRDSPVDEYPWFSRGVTSINDPTSSRNPCGDSGGYEVKMEIRLDYCSYETYWSLKNLDTDDVIAQVFYIECDSTEYFEYDFCLDTEYCYKFEIFDDFGDGMSYGYEQFYDFSVDGNVIATTKDDPNGNFGSSESVTFGDCLPPPPPCARGKDKFMLEMRTDDYGDEISWMVLVRNNGVFEVSFGNGYNYGLTYPNNKGQREKYCIPDDECYKFTILDSYGDGFSQNNGLAGYRVTFNNEVIIESLFDVTFYESVDFNCD